jgi:hypothetical protein
MRRWGFLLAGVVVGVLLWRLALDQGPLAEEALPLEPSSPPASASPRDPDPVADRPTTPATSDGTLEKPATAASPSPAAAAPKPTEDLVPIPAPEASGPIAELKQAFEKEPRDSAAQLPESRIESEFRKSDIAPGLLKSVLCRKSVCRVETLWTPERAVSFMSAFMRLSTDFEPNIALDPHGSADPPQALQIDVYLPRRASETKPAEP